MTCGTCQYGDFERTANGKPKRNCFGTCTLPIVLPTIPANAVISIRRIGIWPDDGYGCETYKLKGKS